MRKFNVKVNGRFYEVEIEEVVGSEAPQQTSAPAPAAAPAAAPAPAASSAAAGNIEVKSPIQGTVVKVEASVGDSVTKGARLCVLEAMKMEYDIVAPENGVIATADVTRGATVEDGKVLFTIKG